MWILKSGIGQNSAESASVEIAKFSRIRTFSRLRRGICGSFFLSLSFPRSQFVMKKSSNDTFFVQKEVKKSSFEWNMAMFLLKEWCFRLKKLTA